MLFSFMQSIDPARRDYELGYGLIAISAVGMCWTVAVSDLSLE